MKKIGSLIIAAFLFASCGDSSNTTTTVTDSTASEVTGTDTSGGYNANNGNVNNNSTNTMQDSGAYRDTSRRYSETDTSNRR